MRSNSGTGKSNNNLRDPTMKEHEEARQKGDRETRRSELEPEIGERSKG
jgi:hypothetical protein